MTKVFNKTSKPAYENKAFKVVTVTAIVICALGVAYAGGKRLGTKPPTTTADTTAPTTSVTSPASSDTVSGSVSVSVAAADNVGVSKVELYVNGTLSGTSTASPYSFTWDTTALADGTATLTSVAYDAAGNKSTSAAVSVNVLNTVATTPPTTTTTTTTTSSTSGSLDTSSMTLATNPLQTRALPDLNRIETPTAWNYQAEYPSRASCGASEGLVFEVGTGKAFATPRDVPWIRLLPCDVVKIYYRTEPYKDIVFLGARGDKGKYITIMGVPGTNGELPVFDGVNAVSPPATGTGMPPVFDGFGMFILSRPVNIGNGLTSAAYGYKPGYLHITGLKVQNARTPASYTNLSGAVTSWPAFTAGIYAAPAEHLAITNCELASNGIGFFIKSDQDYMAPAPDYLGNARQSRGLLVRNNYFHDNGIVGNTSLHNAYSEVIGSVYEYNYFGRPNGTSADNIKERSAGVIFRNNYIDGGMHAISLRDPESNGPYEAIQKDALGEDLVKYAFVYNNHFTQRGIDANGGILIGHGDGDFGAQMQYRYGKLFFYNNRVVSKYDYLMYGRDGAPLFEMLNYNRGTVVNALNNLFYAVSATSTGTPAPFALFFWGGVANFPTFVDGAGVTQPSNWINRYIETMPNYGNYASSPSNPNLYAGTKYDGTGHPNLIKQTNDPGFTDFVNGDYSLKSSSVFYTLKAPLPAEVTARSLTPSGDPVMGPFKAPALP